MSAKTDMNTLDVRKILILLGHAFVGWALCFATIAIGRATTTMDVTLIIHAIFTPIFFCLVSLFYFARSSYTSPFVTALTFVGFVIFIDFFSVALVINQSLEMFASLIGTWIPFALIFVTTYLTGWVVTHREQRRVRSA
jgi:hypothetical protein